MTLREWKKINATYKGDQLRALGHRRGLPYPFFHLHLVINCQTMFVKSALMQAKRTPQWKSDVALMETHSRAT